jgi:hypothetical protein
MFFVLIFHLRDDNMPCGGRSLETQCHLIDMIIIIIMMRFEVLTATIIMFSPIFFVPLRTTWP